MIAEELLEQGCGLALGRYTLLRKIAVGGMAEVYVARSQGVSGFAKRVALKKILPQYSHNRKFLEMLLDEAKISVSLTHPNIAQVYELGVGAQETHFIVMEYVEGRPLNRVLQRALERGQPGLPITHAVHVMSEVAKGLDHAHKQTDAKGRLLQIVHRDVSPQNVLLSYQGSVKLIDFGIARAQGRAAQTGHGIIKGKLRYLAPEIAAGVEPDHRADLFCCGLVLYELLTGEPMYSPNNDLHALEMARKAQVRSPRSLNRAVPEDLDAIVMRMLARDRNERYSTGKDVHADLRMFLNRFDPLFNENELGDYMQSMFKGEMAESKQLDSLAEKIASKEGQLAEEPTVAVAEADLLTLKDPGATARTRRASSSNRSASSPKLRLVGADGGAPMSVVLERKKSVAPLVGEGSPPRTMPRGTFQPAPPRPGENSELIGPHDESRSIRVTMPEVEEVSLSFLDDKSVPGALVEDIEAIPLEAPKPKAVVVQAPTTTIQVDEAARLGLLEPLPAPAIVPKSIPPLAASQTAAAYGAAFGASGVMLGAARPKVELSARTASATRTGQPPRRALALVAAATIVVSLACLLISVLISSEPAAREAIAQEENTVIIPVPAPAPAPQTATVVELVPASAAREQPDVILEAAPPPPEPIRLKSYEDAPAEEAIAGEEEAPQEIAVEDPEPGDEEPDRARPDRPYRISGGTILVNSRPVSTIFVDGKRIGRTPKVITLKPGRHEIALEGPNGQQKNFARKITAGKNPPVTHRWR